MKANPGRCPTEAMGKRVRVWLGCNWSLTGSQFDIAFYEVI